MSEQPPGSKPNYGSATRVAQIAHWLHQHPFGISLEELRDRLGVSDRTLTRYIQTLKEGFYDEEGEPLVEVVRTGPQGRLRFKRRRIQVKGTAYELMSLYMALDLMAFLEGTFLLEGAQQVLDQLQKTLLREHGNETSLVLKDFHKKFFHWTEAPKDYSAHNEHLTRLVKALVLQKNVEMTYQSPGKPEKNHCLSPLSLLMFKRALYLVAQATTIQEGETSPRRLTFAIERIKQVRLLRDGFFYPHDYQPERRFQSTFGLVRETAPQPVKLHFHATVAQNVASRRWHGSQKQIWQEDGSLELSFEVEIGSEFIAWILSYGHYIRVIEPETLKERIKNRLAQSLAQYAPEPGQP